MDDQKKPIDLGHDDGVDGSCKDGRSRTWMLLLYPDNDDMFEVLTSILPDLDWNYAGRVHDQDPGTKLHHHVVVLFKDGRKAADVAADLHIDKKWLRAWDSKRRAFRYLCHRDNPEKFQYSPDAIYGTCADAAIKACGSDKRDECADVASICDFMFAYDGLLSYDMMLRYVSSNGLYPTFRRMGVIAIRLMEEHNNSYIARGKKNEENPF